MILLEIKSNGKTKYTKLIKKISKLHEATSFISTLISRHKDEYQNYIASRLNDPKTNTKMYWSVLKTFYNSKKVPIIPLLLISYKLTSDFEVKANNFNEFFTFQCKP